MTEQHHLYCLIPLKHIVIFPGETVSFFVGREFSVNALQAAERQGDKIVTVAQLDTGAEEVDIEDLASVGTAIKILQIFKLPDSTIKVLVSGESRINISNVQVIDNIWRAEGVEVETVTKDPKEIKIIYTAILNLLSEYSKMSKLFSEEFLSRLTKMTDYEKAGDLIAAHLNIKANEKQEILDTSCLDERLEILYTLIYSEISLNEFHEKMRAQVRAQVEKTQKEYYLNEQLKVIQKELGENGKDELQELSELLAKKRLPQLVKQKVENELKKLKNANQFSSEAGISRTYIDWILNLPWFENTHKNLPLSEISAILDKDHYGLEKVKERIIEYLAVQKRNPKSQGAVLCFVGPPGVGKTSLAKSIAEALGRKFSRISLGGLRDEAELRGHRKTYIGALPGKIIQAMRKAKANNPLILLDEIDKMGSDMRGDPTGPILEILDPEQNKTFKDHYLELEYDLSKVMFICTCNSTDMPRPLRDRMEMISLSSYTEQEKFYIAKDHLITKQLKDTGLTKEEIQIEDKAILEIIRHYTSEAGVRELQRAINKICRKVLLKILSQENTTMPITKENLTQLLGPPKYVDMDIKRMPEVGCVNGLAWTSVGGCVMLVEAVLMPGKGEIHVTGMLGEVMEESTKLVFNYIKSKANVFGIDKTMISNFDVHVHFPEAATEKDGPSAGVAIANSILSAMLQVNARPDIAMTGELSLRGKVLAIGGLKEKLIAALKEDIKEVIIPKSNVKDLAEIPEYILSKLTVHSVEHVREAFNLVLGKTFDSN